MTTAAEGFSSFDMGRVVGRIFGVIGRNFVVFALLAIVLAGIPVAVARYFQQTAVLGGGFGIYLISACASLLSYLGMNVLQSAIIHGAVDDLNEKKASFGDCLATGIRFLLPVIGLSILTGLALAVGFILLIVPGILMALAWTVNVPVLVVEKKGVFDAFGRSAELTRGHRGAIFLLFLVYAVVTWIISAVGLAVTGGLDLAALSAGGFKPAQWAVLSVLQVIEALVGAAGVASIYYELRSIKDGIGPSQLASVFD
jgi:hypothetical protein